MQQAAKLQIENFGLPPFFFLFLSFKCTSMVFFLLATYIFLGLCSYVLLVITLSDDGNISIIQKKERRDKLEWNWESYLWSPLVIHWVLPPPMVGTRSVSLHAHEWALLLPYTVYAMSWSIPNSRPSVVWF